MNEVCILDWITDDGSFVEFISYVLLSAPEDFPREDYLRDDEQMTLDKAFAELRGGLRFVAARVKDDSGLAKLQDILDASHRAYLRGEATKGAHLLQDLRESVLELI